MAYQLENGDCDIRQCWDIYEQNSVVESVCADDWTAEWAIIASNVNILQHGIN